MKNHLRLIAIVIAQLAIIAACLVWYFAPWAAAGVQPIEVKRGPHSTIGAPDGLTEVHSLAELRHPNSVAVAQLSRPLDFTREKLVRVNWSDTGPLNARMASHVRWGGRKIAFFIEEPAANRATFSRMIYENWYTVPCDAEVRFAGRETLTVAVFNLFVLGGVALFGITLAFKRRWRAARGGASG